VSFEITIETEEPRFITNTHHTGKKMDVSKGSVVATLSLLWCLQHDPVDASGIHIRDSGVVLEIVFLLSTLGVGKMETTFCHCQQKKVS
jgi:hypothetical protein